MGLSTLQKEMLERSKVPQELYERMDKELGSEGHPKEEHSKDFLMVLADFLQEAENSLSEHRFRYNKAFTENRPNLDFVEEDLKNDWSKASNLWVALDQVVSNPKAYAAEITPKHVKFALQKKNLPFIELLRFANPSFFLATSNSTLARIGGLLGGGLFGLLSGMVGGLRLALKSKSSFKIFYVVLYPFRSLLTSWFEGARWGAEMGYETGSVLEGVKFGIIAAYLNPFREPRGNQNQQAVELKRLETLFKIQHD